MIDDIEDNYPEYLDDERGYQFDAWDVLPADVVRRHDAIAQADAARLAELDPAGLDDLDRWAYARASRNAGDQSGFLAGARLIITSTEDHRGLDYADVFVAVIEAHADAELGDEAALHLRTFRERFPDDGRAVRLEVYLAARTERLADVLTAAINEVRDDAERLFEIAEDLASVDDAASGRVLDRAAQLATQQRQRSLLLDIALLRDVLERRATE